MKPNIVTTPERSRLMARVRQSGTAAELTVRTLLNRSGVLYQTQAKELSGRPDLVGRGKKWAIFVHGCFWHAHEGCKRWKLPKTNISFWKSKFEQNRRRDKKDIHDLRRLGYSVLVVWECELQQQKELKKKLFSFLSRNGETKIRIANLTTHRQREQYRYDDDSVVRIVRLTDGRKTTTRMPVLSKGEDPRSAFDYAYLRKSTPPRLPRNHRVVRVADLFSGCGGLSLGAMEACRALGLRFLSAAALDKDSTCLNVYQHNFGCKALHSQDIAKVLNGRIGHKQSAAERHFLRRTKDVTILLAGPPCQGNSDLNNHTRRKDPRNVLYERVARFVELAKPKHVLIENVSTAIHGKERAVQRSIAIMRRLGYNVDSGIIDLSTIGVPQRRKRHIVVASMTKEVRIADVIERHGVDRRRSVRWGIGDLQHEVSNGIYTRPAHHTSENISRIGFLHQNGLYELPNKLRPPCHRNGRHSYKSMYGRLRFGEPAQTITSGFGSPGQGRFVHPTRRRTLTHHEAARLQFFPDFFDFSKVQKRAELASMIGNAAPMKLSYVFCLELLA